MPAPEIISVGGLMDLSLEVGRVEERALIRPLLVDLAVFADRHHDFDSGDCHPQPGVDCWPFCDACKVLARVPADVVDEARRVREERES